MNDVRPRTDAARAMGVWPDIALAAGAVAVAVNVVLLVIAWPRGDELWAVGHIVVLATSIVVRVRRPDLAVSAWIGISLLPAALSEIATTSLSALLESDGPVMAIATASAIGLVTDALAGVTTIQVLAVFPDDQLVVGWERRVLAAVWAFTVLPVVIVLASSEIPIPSYIGDGTPIENPLHLLPWSVSSGPVDAYFGFSAFLLVGGIAILVAHYRRADPRTRRRIRWLLVPLPLVPFGVALQLLLGESGQVVVWIVFLLLIPAISVAGTIGILQPEGWDADSVLRRGMVYGVLWLAIVAVFVGVGAVVGTTAGRYVPVGWAVAIAVVVALLFQPLRRRLESWAERWVFGARVDHSGVITKLGATLADTFELENLLPRMVAALEEGLQVTWARVRLRGVADDESRGDPAAVVPIDLDGEQLGVVECGPKRDGQWTDDDRSVVASFARQAALAVRNVRLAEQTARYAVDLEVSRARIARAAESERRRIERNIHDGIQQDLVVLIGMAGQVQSEHDPDVMHAALAELRQRLERMLVDLRALATGIYPSVLSDQGVLPAVEALVASHPRPVRLRADATLREVRLPDEIEGAAYFTVAEALTNSLKHADARRVVVTLSRDNGALLIEVEDDGSGFDLASTPSGRGLDGLADRLGALGGTFGVRTEVGRGTVVQAALSTSNEHAT